MEININLTHFEIVIIKIMSASVDSKRDGKTWQLQLTLYMNLATISQEFQSIFIPAWGHLHPNDVLNEQRTDFSGRLSMLNPRMYFRSGSMVKWTYGT
jgi:hypothetical protein